MRFLPILLLAACASKGTPSTPPVADELPEEWTSCKTDDDCVVIELGCCDACNGGKRVVANEASAEEVYATHGKKCEPDSACTMMACELFPPVCRNKQCALR